MLFEGRFEYLREGGEAHGVPRVPVYHLSPPDSDEALCGHARAGLFVAFDAPLSEHCPECEAERKRTFVVEPEMESVLRIVRAAEEIASSPVTPPPPGRISTQSGLDLEEVKALMAEAHFRRWAIFFGESARPGSPIRSAPGGWVLLQRGRDVLDEVDAKA